MSRERHTIQKSKAAAAEEAYTLLTRFHSAHLCREKSIILSNFIFRDVFAVATVAAFDIETF